MDNLLLIVNTVFNLAKQVFRALSGMRKKIPFLFLVRSCLTLGDSLSATPRGYGLFTRPYPTGIPRQPRTSFRGATSVDTSTMG